MDAEALFNHFETFVREASELSLKSPPLPFHNVIVGGTGTGALAGELLALLNGKMPVEVIQSSRFPPYAGPNTLAFLLSYSGKNDDILSLYQDAKTKRCQLITLTSGGPLKDKCFDEKLPFIKLPAGIPLNFELPYYLIPMLKVLESAGIVEVSADIQRLRESVRNPKVMEKAKDLSEGLVEKVPLIYAQKLLPVARRWKAQFNSAAKVHAFAAPFAELFSTELDAFLNVKADYFCVFLIDDEDSLSLKRQAERTKQKLVQRGIPVIEIASSGKSLLVRAFTGIYLGDLTALYVGRHYDVDFSQKLVEVEQ